MPEYLHPGVYIEEIERGPKPIEGVPTSTAAFLGEAERGPTKPRLVTSYKDYQRWFGGVFGDDQVHALRRERLLRERRQAPVRVPRHGRCSDAGRSGVRQLHRPRRGSRMLGQAGVRPDHGWLHEEGGCQWPAGRREFRLLLAYFSAQPTPKDLEWFDTPNSSPPPPYFEASTTSKRTRPRRTIGTSGCVTTRHWPN